MPTIEISLKDISALLGKKLGIDELGEKLEYAKGEIENVEGDRIRVEIADTNRPDLWSTEGIAREIRGSLSNQKGMARYKIGKSGLKVKVDRNLKGIRPRTVCAVVKGLKITDEIIFQIIQLQEKICETFGRKRRDVALGIYDYHKIKPPVYFRAYEPDKISFVPLDSDRKMNLRQILLKHPKGREYGELLRDFKKYPVFIDSERNVLSMPPVINSEYTGKVSKFTKDVFVECSGFEMKFLSVALDTMTAALADRGGKVESVEVEYPNERVTTPSMKPGSITVDLGTVRRISGIDLEGKGVKRLLEEAGYDVKMKGKKFMLRYPSYRQDIMHPSDVIEDIIIRYGYNNIDPAVPELPTRGCISEMNRFSDVIRDLMVGVGGQEILSYYLTNKNHMIEMMGMKKIDCIEVENPVSGNWSVFRTWLIPSLMEFLSKNKNREYPQKIFEIGEVVLVDRTAETRSKSPSRVAWADAGKSADFTSVKQVLDFLMNSLEIDYQIRETDHPSFIPGRVGRVYVDGKAVAYIGEVSPKVLENWSIEQPVSCFELNLTDLMSASGK